MAKEEKPHFALFLLCHNLSKISQLQMSQKGFNYTNVFSCKFKTDRNIWPMVNSIEVKVEKTIFAKKFPHFVKQFEDRVSIKISAGLYPK